MRQWRRQAPFWIGGTAAAGVVAAHVLTYLLAEPHGAHRASLLRETGHAAWPYVSALGVGCLAAALVHFTLTRAATAGPPAWSPVAARLVLLQAAGWVVLEASERLLAGHTAAEVLHDPVVAVGLGVQVAVALAATLLLSLLGRVVDAVVRARARTRWAPAPVVVRPVTLLHRPPVRLAAGGVGLRGPPA